MSRAEEKVLDSVIFGLAHFLQTSTPYCFASFLKGRVNCKGKIQGGNLEMENISKIFQSISTENLFTILLGICAVLVVILVITVILSVKSNRKEKKSEQIFGADFLESPEQVPDSDDESLEEESEQDPENPDEYEEEFDETPEQDELEEDEEDEETSEQEPDRFFLEESEQVHAKRSDLISEKRLPEPDVAEEVVEEKTDEVPFEDSPINEDIVEEDRIQTNYIPEMIPEAELMPAQDTNENIVVENEYVARHANKHQQYFETVTDKLDVIHEGQNAIMDTVESFNGRFDANKDAFDELRREFDALKKDVDTRLCMIGEQVHRKVHESNESNYKVLNKQIQSLSAKNDDIEKMFQTQTSRLGEDIQNLRKELNAIPNQLGKLSSPSEETVNQMAKIEAKVDLLGSQILVVANSIAQLQINMDNKINNLSMTGIQPEIKSEYVQNQEIYCDERRKSNEQIFEADSKATSEMKSEVVKMDSQEVSQSNTNEVAKDQTKPVEKKSKDVDTNKSSSEKPMKKVEPKEEKKQSAKAAASSTKSKNTRSHRKTTKKKQTVLKNPVKQEKSKPEVSPEEIQARRLEHEANLQSRFDEEIKESKMIVKDMESSGAVALSERPEALKNRTNVEQTQDNVKAFQEKMRKRKEQREQIEREKAAKAQSDEIETVSAKVIPSDGSNHYASNSYQVPVQQEQSDIEKADAIVNSQPQQEAAVYDESTQTRPVYERVSGGQAHQRRTSRPTRASYVSNRATRA